PRKSPVEFLVRAGVVGVFRARHRHWPSPLWAGVCAQRRRGRPLRADARLPTHRASRVSRDDVRRVVLLLNVARRTSASRARRNRSEILRFWPRFAAAAGGRSWASQGGATSRATGGGPTGPL